MTARRLAVAAIVLAAVLARAAGQGEDAWGDRFRSGDDAEEALPSLRELRLEDFESSTAVPWFPSISASDGVAEAKIADANGGQAGRALGVKVAFMRRALSTLDLRPSRPVRIEGRCASLSIRAYGFGYPHELILLVLDYYGNEHELSLGRLDFHGWRRLEAAIPLREAGLGSAFVQDDRHFRDLSGLRVAGIRIAFDLEESYGQYVVYFDDLEALVDAEGDAAGAREETAPTPAEAAPAPRADAATSSPAATPEARMLVLEEIEKRIAATMTYPEAARRRGIEGTMTLSFRVDAGGSLVSARVSKGSGSDILDRAGLDLLRGAFPVRNDSGLALELDIPITFRLDGSRRD